MVLSVEGIKLSQIINTMNQYVVTLEILVKGAHDYYYGEIRQIWIYAENEIEARKKARHEGYSDKNIKGIIKRECTERFRNDSKLQNAA